MVYLLAGWVSAVEVRTLLFFGPFSGNFPRSPLQEHTLNPDRNPQPKTTAQKVPKIAASSQGVLGTAMWGLGFRVFRHAGLVRYS